MPPPTIQFSDCSSDKIHSNNFNLVPMNKLQEIILHIMHVFLVCIYSILTILSSQPALITCPTLPYVLLFAFSSQFWRFTLPFRSLPTSTLDFDPDVGDRQACFIETTSLSTCFPSDEEVVQYASSQLRFVLYTSHTIVAQTFGNLICADCFETLV